MSVDDLAPARDEVAEVLLGADCNTSAGRDARDGFKHLARLLAAPQHIAKVARRCGVSRQSVYRGLEAARAAGYGPQVDSVLKRARGSARRTAITAPSPIRATIKFQNGEMAEDAEVEVQGIGRMMAKDVPQRTMAWDPNRAGSAHGLCLHYREESA